MTVLTPELIEELAKTTNGFYSWDYVSQLASRVIELEAEHRWIPVSERLPEEDGYYNIAFSISNAKNITDIYYFKSDSKCKWYSDIYCRSVATFFDTVSHWQNTIKPPESEEE